MKKLAIIIALLILSFPVYAQVVNGGGGGSGGPTNVSNATGILPIVNGGNTFNAIITNAPYNASGFIAQTVTSTSVSSGSTVIPVNSTAGFNVGQIAGIALGGTSGHKFFGCTIAAVTPATPSITCSGTALTGNALTKSPIATSGTSLTTTVPANYVVYSTGNTTISAASTGATSLTFANATSYAAGQGLFIYGGATSGANLLTTIQSVTGNTVVISPGISNASGVAAGTVVKHDDTAAIQAAINLANYNTVINIYVPDGYYQLNGAFSGDNAAAMVEFPNLNYYNNCCLTSSSLWNGGSTILIMGNVPAPQAQSYLAENVVPYFSGAIFQTDNTSPAFNTKSVFGAYNTDGSLANTTNIQVVFRNLTFRSQPGGAVTMINGAFIQEVSIFNSSFDTGETGIATQPSTNGNSNAFIGPGGDNGGNNVFSQLEIFGYANGSQVSEHSRLEHIRYDSVTQPVTIATATNTTQANYGVTAVDLQFNGCPHGITHAGSTSTNIDFSLINIEHQSTPAWAANVDDISDSSNKLFGFVGIDSPLDSNTQTVTGGANLHIVNARSAAYPLATYTFATLNASSPNGTIGYCSDCTIASPCAGSGTGAIAKMLNGAWVCN